MFIEHQGIRRSVFERACGFSNGYTRNLKENPSASKIEDILMAYPELNRVWLLSGEGEMLKSETVNIGEVSGGANTIGMSVNQSISKNSGQNAGRDLINHRDKSVLEELAAQRKLTETAQEQLATAQEQISVLIKQNQEQFNRFMSLIQNLQSH